MNSPSESLQHNALHWSRSAENEKEEKLSTQTKNPRVMVIVDAGVSTATLISKPPQGLPFTS